MEDTLDILDQIQLHALQSTSNASPAPELIEEARAKLGWVSQNVAEHTLAAEGHNTTIEELPEASVEETLQVAGAHSKSQQIGRGILHRHILLGDEIYRGKDSGPDLCWEKILF